MTRTQATSANAHTDRNNKTNIKLIKLCSETVIYQAIQYSFLTVVINTNSGKQIELLVLSNIVQDMRLSVSTHFSVTYCPYSKLGSKSVSKHFSVTHCLYVQIRLKSHGDSFHSLFSQFDINYCFVIKRDHFQVFPNKFWHYVHNSVQFSEHLHVLLTLNSYYQKNLSCNFQIEGPDSKLTS